MEVAGHLILFLLAIAGAYGMLADRHSRDLRRLVVAVPVIGLLWFGLGGVLTTIVGYSVGTQLFLGLRLYLTWQRNK